MFDLETFFRDFFKVPMPSHKAKWVKVMTDMSVHTKKAIPYELINCRRPNETQEVYNYRIKTYKPITYGSMNRATDELYRIVSGIGYKMNVPDTTAALMKENIFENYTFELYLQQVVLRRMIEDPNGLLVWLPSGPGVQDNSEKAIPKPYLVCSEYIHYMDDELIAFLSEEKSLVKVGKSWVYEGQVFYILTKNDYYQLRQVGLKSEMKFEVVLVYEHGIGEIPYCVLGGDKNETGYFDSFFAPYLAFGDEAICQFSDWQAVMVQTGYPFVEEFHMDCELEEVREQRADKLSNPIPDQEETYKKRTEKRAMTKSPHGTIIRDVPDDKNNTFGKAYLPADVASIRFIQADVATVQNAWSVVKELIKFAEDALHLNLGQGLISGEAKIQDKKAQGAMLLKIGNNFFDNIFLSSLIYIDAYYNYHEADRVGISIDKPVTYDVKTEQDLVDEWGVLKTSKAPAYFLQQTAMDLAGKRFSGNKLMLKITDCINIIDPINIYDTEQQGRMLLAGSITKEANVRSIYLPSLLRKIALEMTYDAFVNAPIQTIEDKFNTMVVPYIPLPAAPSVDPSGNLN